MTRGRRPDLTLEPSRQLQTQRAFRQRKAEHLRYLEETVKSQAEEIERLKAGVGGGAGAPVGVDIRGGAEGQEGNALAAASASPSARKRARTSTGAGSAEVKLEEGGQHPPPSRVQSPAWSVSLGSGSSSSPGSTTAEGSGSTAATSTTTSTPCRKCTWLEKRNAELVSPDATERIAAYMPCDPPQLTRNPATHHPHTFTPLHRAPSRSKQSAQ